MSAHGMKPRPCRQQITQATMASAAPTDAGTGSLDADEASLPADLLDDIRNGGNGRGSDASRSALSHKVTACAVSTTSERLSPRR